MFKMCPKHILIIFSELKSENDKKTEDYLSKLSDHEDLIRMLNEEITEISYALCSSQEQADILGEQLSSEQEMREEMVVVVSENEQLRHELGNSLYTVYQLYSITHNFLRKIRNFYLLNIKTTFFLNRDVISFGARF